MGGGASFNEGAIGLWPRLALAQGTPPLGTGSSGELGNNASTANLHPPDELSRVNPALLFAAHCLEAAPHLAEFRECLSQSYVQRYPMILYRFHGGGRLLTINQVV